MDIGTKIYELRKQNNITQEQLAVAIGVSAPAVCKWETGVSLPDISLLAPIARKLNTDLDDLLSFNQALSAAEIEKIVSEINNAARNHGLDAAMEVCYGYLKKYPNADALKLQTAILPIKMAYTADDKYFEDEEKYQKLLDQTTKMLEEITHSEDDMLRMSAIVSLAARYMEQKRFDEAETILNKLPKQDFDARHLYPSLYTLKGEYDKVVEYCQANMLQDIQHILVDIRGQHTIYLKNKDYEKALKCAKDYFIIIQTIGHSAMCGSELLVSTYLAMEKMEDARECFLHYIEEIKNISVDYSKSFYYTSISCKKNVCSSDIEDDVRKSLYKYVLLDDRYKILRDSKQVEEKLNELKQVLFQE